MTARPPYPEPQAKAKVSTLERGDRVLWRGNPKDAGVVLDETPWAVLIQWDATKHPGWVDRKDISPDISKAAEVSR